MPHGTFKFRLYRFWRIEEEKTDWRARTISVSDVSRRSRTTRGERVARQHRYITLDHSASFWIFSVRPRTFCGGISLNDNDNELKSVQGSKGGTFPPLITHYPARKPSSHPEGTSPTNPILPSTYVLVHRSLFLLFLLFHLPAFNETNSCRTFYNWFRTKAHRFDRRN